MICVSPLELSLIQSILKKHAPDCEARVFGSRYKWTANDYSDLDIALAGEKKLTLKKLCAVKDAFEESTLPFRVDVLDWNAVSAEFRKIISNGYEVIYAPKKQKTAWPTVLLGDICEIKHGFAFKGESFCKVKTAKILLTPGNFYIGGGFKSDKNKYYNGDVPEDYILAEHDLIVTMTDLSVAGDTLGYSALIPKDNDNIYLHNQRIGRVIVTSNKISKYFLYWLMRTSRYQKFIVATASGTTVKHTSPKSILKYVFPLPPLPTQQAIAATLSCLDAKIELNNRINANLEAQAQAIFKSWFVDFEPFQGGEFVDSELGKIPKGWRVGTLGEIANIIMGQSPDGKSYNESGEGEVFYQGRRDFGWRFPRNRLYTTEPKRRGKKGDVLLSVRAPVGDLNVADEDCCIGRGLASLNSKNTSFLLYSMFSLKSKLQQFNGTGTVFGCINKDDLHGMKIVIPPEKVISDFEYICSKMDGYIFINSQEIKKLSFVRDALLPRLMSGEIKIKEENL
jgi:type I restriction enzyme S subunit